MLYVYMSEKIRLSVSWNLDAGHGKIYMYAMQKLCKDLMRATARLAALL